MWAPNTHRSSSGRYCRTYPELRSPSWLTTVATLSVARSRTQAETLKLSCMGTYDGLVRTPVPSSTAACPVTPGP